MWESEARILSGILGVSRLYIKLGDALGVMVIVVGNEHGDMSSNPGRDWLQCT